MKTLKYPLASIVVLVLASFALAAGKTPKEFVMPFTAASKDDAVRWQETARAKLLELVEKQEPQRSVQSLPLAFQMGTPQDKGEYTLYPVSFQGNAKPGLRRAGLLAVPKGKGPFPAMLALHGHSGSAQAVFDPKSIYHGFVELMDVCEVHLLIAPRPVLFESAEHDGCFPIRYTRQGFERIKAGYRVFDAESAVQQDVWPAGHEWHGVMAYPLVDKALGGHAAK